jgi:thymidylate synthase (FAD)
MKIIDQSYEIINLPENSLELIEAAGRTCYKSEDKIGCTLDECSVPEDRRKFKWYSKPVGMGRKQVCTGCPYHSSHKFVKMLIDRGHHAMLEFGDITVRFITNRGVTHELVRHRLFSFAQESTRYVKYNGEMEFIRPVWWDGSTLYQKTAWEKAMRFVEHNYQKLIKEGWRPEQAREVLPNSLKTEIVVKANLREWRHIFQLRCSKKAHPQMRSLMINLLIDLKTKIPLIFDDIEV